jgi:hypothetical protein
MKVRQIEIRSKEGERGYRNIEKPVVAERYNNSMGGVDLLKQKLQTYAFPHKSSKYVVLHDLPSSSRGCYGERSYHL